ncbi:ubiquitin C-terminal hydrolase 13-like [Lycium ferocissimum]|uniref:ubiquitin C-terminal hydrolase 13-like n=1 Tax=Lycium ferocissimum TaxID=112874 RepID=UPI0028157230|nr:ubiquitin C-terminal hydrolase 13-like [Lycium ferocissimum]
MVEAGNHLQVQVGQLREDSNKTNNAELKLFLEVDFGLIEDGDIICFQKNASPEVEEQVRFPDVPSYLEYVKNRQIVHFRALEKPKEEDFCLELAKSDTSVFLWKRTLIEERIFLL